MAAYTLGAARGRRAQLLGDGVAERGHPQRVEPEVRIQVAVVVALVVLGVLVPLGRGLEADDLAGLERVALVGLLDRLVDGGWKPAR